MNTSASEINLGTSPRLAALLTFDQVLDIITEWPRERQVLLAEVINQRGFQDILRAFGLKRDTFLSEECLNRVGLFVATVQNSNLSGLNTGFYQFSDVRRQICQFMGSGFILTYYRNSPTAGVRDELLTAGDTEPFDGT